MTCAEAGRLTVPARRHATGTEAVVCHRPRAVEHVDILAAVSVRRIIARVERKQLAVVPLIRARPPAEC